MSTSAKYHAKKLTPLNSRILVKGMEFHERLTRGGILLPGDDKTTAGIRPRWAEVVAVGPDQCDVEVGEYVLVEHGRWTRGIQISVAEEDMVLRMIDENSILLVSTVPQIDETSTSAVEARVDRERTEGSLHRDGTQDKHHIAK